MTEMTQHQQRGHDILWPDKEYAKKGIEDKDLETDDEAEYEEDEEDDITNNKY